MAGTVFANTLQTLRKKRGVTQEQLAAYLGVSPQAVSKWENGSYPDGDLLPRIADYFQVTIDYLYGRDTEKVSVEQMVMDSIKNIPVNEKLEHHEHFEQIMRYLWAAQTGFWVENKTYYDRSEPEGDHVVASSIADEAGFTFFRLNKSLEYYVLMKEPEEGFASFFQVTDRLVEFFAFLGKKENLEVLLYLLSLKNGECVSCSTISKRLEIPEETAKEALDYLSLPVVSSGNQMLQNVCLLDEYDKREKIYAINLHTATAILILLAGADGFLNPPGSYALSVSGSDRAWLERDKLNFLKARGQKQDENNNRKK
ncbi:MAG: helix-turn-helix domain-containing protein [Acetatifactor sp.]